MTTPERSLMVPHAPPIHAKRPIVTSPTSAAAATMYAAAEAVPTIR